MTYLPTAKDGLSQVSKGDLKMLSTTMTVFFVLILVGAVPTGGVQLELREKE